MRNLKIAGDPEIHVSLEQYIASRQCTACTRGFPQQHTCMSRGLLHAEFRYSLEAGIQEMHRLERCTTCEYEAFIPVDADGNELDLLPPEEGNEQDTTGEGA